ncbi:MAG: carboxymuconolactone decarboxylase family protein [Dehalococcoidia bacterium]|nr:carboxymuconolactone decarboxylase family protein [Dehalococcoidia bacterium]
MTWLPSAAASTPEFDAVLGLRPELRDLFRRFYATPWDDDLLPRSVLELCRLRVAGVHDCAAELAIQDPEAGLTPEKRAALAHWQDSHAFSPLERAALAIAEKMPWQHHEISDADYAELRRHLDEPATVALTVALALFDAGCRLRLVLDVAPAPAATAPSAARPLH